MAKNFYIRPSLIAKIDQINDQHPGIRIDLYSPRLFLEIMKAVSKYGLCEFSSSFKDFYKFQSRGQALYTWEFKIYDYQVTMDMNENSGILISCESLLLRDELYKKLRQKFCLQNRELFQSEKPPQ